MKKLKIVDEMLTSSMADSTTWSLLNYNPLYTASWGAPFLPTS